MRRSRTTAPALLTTWSPLTVRLGCQPFGVPELPADGNFFCFLAADRCVESLDAAVASGAGPASAGDATTRAGRRTARRTAGATTVVQMAGRRRAVGSGDKISRLSRGQGADEVPSLFRASKASNPQNR